LHFFMTGLLMLGSLAQKKEILLSIRKNNLNLTEEIKI